MTEQEKAKAFDEALERFHQFKEKYYSKKTHFGDVLFDKTGEMQKDFDSIFPQLAESEDEKIRKKLIEIVGYFRSRGIDQQLCEKFLDYLEKQKEPHYTKRNALFDKCVENCDPEVMKEVSNKIDEVLGKEQKPVECELEDAFKYYTDAGITVSCGDIVAKPKEQKPAEWSEEDKKIIDTIVSVLGQYIDYKTVSGTGSGYATPRYSKEIDWLNSLRSQYHGDVTMTEAYKMGKEAGEASHWKPSEEQMEALEKTIRLANFGLEEDRRKVLKSLCEQLKKLM